MLDCLPPPAYWDSRLLEAIHNRASRPVHSLRNLPHGQPILPVPLVQLISPSGPHFLYTWSLTVSAHFAPLACHRPSAPTELCPNSGISPLWAVNDNLFFSSCPGSPGPYLPVLWTGGTRGLPLLSALLALPTLPIHGPTTIRAVHMPPARCLFCHCALPLVARPRAQHMRRVGRHVWCTPHSWPQLAAAGGNAPRLVLSLLPLAAIALQFATISPFLSVSHGTTDR